jgi:uncharacterized membrane protein YuzA (DUF378 family)
MDGLDKTCAFICALGILIAGSLEYHALDLGVDGTALAAVIASIVGLAGLFIGRALEKRHKR